MPLLRDFTYLQNLIFSCIFFSVNSQVRKHSLRCLTNVFVVRDPKIFRSFSAILLFFCCCCLKLFTNKWLSDFVLFIVYPTLESVKNSREWAFATTQKQFKNSTKNSIYLRWFCLSFFFFFVLRFVYYRLCLYLLLDFCTRRTWLRYFFTLLLLFILEIFICIDLNFLVFFFCVCMNMYLHFVIRWWLL